MSHWLWKHKWRVGGGLLLGGVAAGLWAGCRLFSAPAYDGPTSDHFDGECFANQARFEQRGLGALLEWELGSGERTKWPKWVEAAPGPPPPRRVGRGDVRVTWVNHATVLLQMDGLNILTDPVWSERVSPVSWTGPRRRRPPGVRFDDLPAIDAVVLSHNHYDHLDLPTLERLARGHAPRFVAPLGNTQLLAEHGIDHAGDLDWWQSVSLGDQMRVTLVPAQHFSGRGLCDRKQTLWGGYVFEGPAGVVYFAGDTGWGPHFQQVRERFGRPRLALLPIGAYRPVWFMHPVHMSPAEAVRAHNVLDAEHSVPIHYGTFQLSDEGMYEPVDDLQRALADADVDDESFWILTEGEGRALPPATEAPAAS